MRTFVIEEEKQFAGFIMIQPELLQSGFFEERVGFVRELWVTPPFRQRGYGKLLMETAEAYFRKKEIRKMILTYEDSALGFYERLGFHADGAYKAKNDGNIVVKHI